MKYFKNTSWLLGEKILRMGIGLILSIWLAKYLGPEQFGLLSYAIAFVGLFTVFATLGLDNIVIRELVKYLKDKDKILGTAFVLKLFGSFSALILLFIAILFTDNNEYTNKIIFIIASGMILQSFNVINFYFQAKVLSKYIAYANMISLLVSSFLKIIFIIYKAPLIYFVWLLIFEIFITICGYIYFYTYQNSSIFNWRFDIKLAQKLLSDSWPLILSGFVITIYMKTDQIMIKEMLGNSSVGQYTVATMLSEAWYFIPMLVSSSLFPAIQNAKNNSESLYYSRLQKLYTLMVWIAILIALLMTFLGNTLIDLLYGNMYLQSGKVLVIHIWAGVFVFLGVVSSKWFIIENLQIYSFYRTLAGAIVNIVLNFIWIPKYGIYGAAFATLVSQAIASYIFNATNIKLRQTFKLQTKAIFMPWTAFNGHM